ncbi:MAG: hypothetical protein V1737_00265 [Chloroflexota bacterium]
MTNKDEENLKLVEELERREAGVRDLFEFYVGVETVYGASVVALEEGNISVVSNSANGK